MLNGRNTKITQKISVSASSQSSNGREARPRLQAKKRTQRQANWMHSAAVTYTDRFSRLGSAAACRRRTKEFARQAKVVRTARRQSYEQPPPGSVCLIHRARTGRFPNLGGCGRGMKTASTSPNLAHSSLVSSCAIFRGVENGERMAAHAQYNRS